MAKFENRVVIFSLVTVCHNGFHDCNVQEQQSGVQDRATLRPPCQEDVTSFFLSFEHFAKQQPFDLCGSVWSVQQPMNGEVCFEFCRCGGE
eukprot:1614221-Amphidinium_carterae.1